MMIGYKGFAGLVAVALASSAVPAHAVMTTFATFAPIAPVEASYSNFRWVNDGSNGANGTSGSVFSTTQNGFSPAGPRLVNFSFLVPSLAPFVTNVTASFSLFGGAPSGSIATWDGGTPGVLTQPNISGGFSFTALTPITTAGSAPYTNLLTAVYSDATIDGNRGGAAGSFTASTADGQTVTYTSDFLDFSGVTGTEFTYTLDNIRSVLAALQTGQPPSAAMRTFRANASGSFGADGDLVVIGVPEPQTWGLMLIGFGMVGLQVRRRNRNVITA